MSSGVLNQMLVELKNRVGTQEAMPEDDASVLLRSLRDSLVAGCPKDKRALMLSIKIVDGAEIEIGGVTTHSLGYVKYAAATNGKWEHPRFKGRQNPNEAWADKITEYQIGVFARKYGYEVVVE